MEEQRTTVTETNTAPGQAVQREHITATAAGSTLISRLVWFVAGVIIVLLVFRIGLLLLGANQGSPFVDFVYNLSYPFAWPFFGIFNYVPSYGIIYFEISSLIAIAVYALIAWGISRLVTLGRPASV